MTRDAASADWVLHVCDRESDWSRAVDESLARNDLHVVTCPDVYLALAGLLRRQNGRCLAIFVNVDWIDGSEHAFPDVAARFAGATPIWGYASRRPNVAFTTLASRRIRLLEDRGQLELIVSRIVRSAGNVPVSSGAPAASSPRGSQSDTSGAARMGPQDAPEPAQPLPVPWAGRPNNPSRVPPTQRGDAGQRQSTNAGDPLLTPDELDALTSGDPYERGEA